MGLLDELKTEIDEHPEWDEAHKATIAKMDEQVFLDTFSGKVFTYLKDKGAREGVAVRVEERVYGRKVFFYGNDSAVLQTHTEPSGLARPYTPILDLQKPWWREAFLEHGEGGRLENIGLIAPSVMECLVKYFPKDEAQKFRIGNILKAVGANAEDVSEEYVENDFYGSHDGGSALPLMKQLQDFWQPLVGPDFDIQFANGGGDLRRKLRLVPLTQNGQSLLLSGEDGIRQVLQKIIDQYDNLISSLKRQE